MSQSKPIYNCMLIGRTGAGKSATGNTLINRTGIFKTSCKVTSCTEDPQLESGEFDNYDINVVDTPGLMDTKVDMSVTMDYMCHAMASLPDGFDAFLFVLKYGDKCTPEVVEVIKALRASFGDVFAKDYCIIAITHGENFEMDKTDEGSPQNIKEYCKSNSDSPELLSLLKDSDYRVVLFYNKTSARREESVNSLIQFIQNMKQRSQRYNSNIFAICAKERNEYLINAKLPQLIAPIQKKLSILQQYLEKATEGSDPNMDIKILEKANELLRTIEQESRGTSLMDDLKERVKFIITSLKSIPLKEQNRIEEIKKIKNLVNIIKNPPSRKLSFFLGFMKIVHKVAGVALMVATPIMPAAGVLGVACIAAGTCYEKIGNVVNESFNEKQKRYNQAVSELNQIGNRVENDKLTPLPKME